MAWQGSGTAPGQQGSSWVWAKVFRVWAGGSNSGGGSAAAVESRRWAQCFRGWRIVGELVPRLCTRQLGRR